MSSASKLLFEEIYHSLIARHEAVEHGKIMSSSALKYKDKVFAFYKEDTMVFRLGRTYDIAAMGVENYSLLAPFKTRPPMQDWFCVAFAENKHWVKLANEALWIMRAKIDG